MRLPFVLLHVGLHVGLQLACLLVTEIAVCRGNHQLTSALYSPLGTHPVVCAVSHSTVSIHLDSELSTCPRGLFSLGMRVKHSSGLSQVALNDNPIWKADWFQSSQYICPFCYLPICFCGVFCDLLRPNTGLNHNGKHSRSLITLMPGTLGCT